METIDVRVMCFANGGENFDSSSNNTYVLEGAEKYEIFKKYFLQLLRDDYRTGVKSNEMIRVRVVLYAAGTQGTDDWQVFTYQVTKEDYKQLERNITLGLLELGTFTSAEMVGIAAGKRPSKRVDRKLRGDSAAKEATEDTGSRRKGLVVE